MTDFARQERRNKLTSGAIVNCPTVVDSLNTLKREDIDVVYNKKLSCSDSEPCRFKT